MNKDQSPIASTSVSMGHSPNPQAEPKIPLEPWTILVCADLGFESTTPARVTIADWDGFMSSSNAVLRGTVQGEKPVFIEHRLRSLKDLSPESVAATVAATGSGATPSPAKAPAIDRILSMTAAVADDSGTHHDLAAAVVNEPFFARPAGSWLCLKQLATLVGRRREVRVLVFSAPAQEMPERLELALEHCGVDDLTPDILIYDHPLSLNTADMEKARAIAAQADQYKCMVLAAMDENEPLIGELAQCDTAVPIFQEQRFIPLRRLRKEPQSRCLVLCAPDVRLTGSSGKTTPFNANTAWMIALQWVEEVIAGGSPILSNAVFNAGDHQSIFGAQPAFSTAIKPAITQEAAESGLAVLPQGMRAVPIDALPTMVDAEVAGEPFTCFGMNLLVNRTMRLAGIALASQDGGAAGLRALLEKHLAAYGIVGSESDLKIGDEEGLAVEVTSQRTVGGQPVHFQFQCG